MFHYLEDKAFVMDMRRVCGEIMQGLCHYLKEDYNIGAVFYLVGSGARNLITQNENKPVDLDYNLEIIRCEDFEDCRYIKECTQKSFNKALSDYSLDDCKDSTTPLTSNYIYFNKGNKTKFKIDVCVTRRDNKDNYYRLIHEKTGFVCSDRYFWNKAPQSKKLKKKVDYIKKRGRWQLVRQQYLKIKNKYLTRNDTKNHPSFVCYIEAVNNVYNVINQKN